MKCMISSMSFPKSPLEIRLITAKAYQQKMLVCFHGYQTENKKRGIEQMFMYAYLGMSALVAGYFVAMYKIFY